MRSSLVITLVLVTLASWTLFCHAESAGLLPRRVHDLIKPVSPKKGDKYKVGKTITARVRIIDEELGAYNPKIKLTFQRAIPRPDVNIHLADVDLCKLSKDGYRFKVKSNFQGDHRTNRYRIRYSFRDEEGQHHYVDSGVFKIFPH